MKSFMTLTIFLIILSSCCYATEHSSIASLNLQKRDGHWKYGIYTLLDFINPLSTWKSLVKVGNTKHSQPGASVTGYV